MIFPVERGKVINSLRSTTRRKALAAPRITLTTIFFTFAIIPTH
jgi:hypothetical protein